MHTLYLKTHNITGKQYLGYHGPTNSQKFENYKGSGTRWKRHLKKHGYDVTTEVLCRASTSVERDGRLLAPKWFDDVCLAFSKMYDVVNNSSFANLVHEGGSVRTSLGYKLTQESIAKRTESRKGFKFSQESIDKMRASQKGRKHTQESKDKIGVKNTKINSIRQIYKRASEAGDYNKTLNAFERTIKNPNHRNYKETIRTVYKHTLITRSAA